MEYSNYSLNQLIKNDTYVNFCNIMLSLPVDTETHEKLESILYNCGYKGYSLNSGLSNRDNPKIEIERRLGMSYLLLRNPDTFDALVENNINIFHGTNANALPKILVYGLRSLNNLISNNIEVTTGEKSTRTKKGRSFISLTDVLDIAEGHSTLYPDQKNLDLSFSLVIGTTVDDATNAGLFKVPSAVPEIGLRDTLPEEGISCLLVPSSKVDLVRRMASNKLVLAADDIEDRFYYIDEFGIISINEERLEKFKRRLAGEEELTPTIPGIKQTVFSRIASRIKGVLTDIKDKLLGDDLDYGLHNYK